MNRTIIGIAVATMFAAAPTAFSALLVHYQFDQVNGTGPYTTPDSSGSGNDASLEGGMDSTNLVSGGIGGSNAMRFDGSPTRLEVADGNADLDVTYSSGFTFAGWIRPGDGIAATSVDRWIAGKMGGSGQRGWQIGISDNFYTGGADPTLYVSFFDGPSGSEHEVYAATNPFADNVWTHVAVVFTPGNPVEIYIDGSSVATDPHGGLLNSWNGSNNVPMAIGNRGSDTNSFSGMMDDVRIYDEALDANEIAALIPEPASVSLLMLSAPLFTRRLLRGSRRF